MKTGYEVGYGKPPERTRFQKGKSGNPKGRPKGPLDFQKLAIAELKSKITITEDGKKKMISIMQGLLKILHAKAMKGDITALKMAFDLIKWLPPEAFWKEDTVYVHEVTQTELDALQQFVIETGEYAAELAKDDAAKKASNCDSPQSAHKSNRSTTDTDGE